MCFRRELFKLNSSEIELALYEKVGMGNGIQANNPWLQEMPDPISKITWDNYVTMSPVEMKQRGYKLTGMSTLIKRFALAEARRAESYLEKDLGNASNKSDL